MFHEKQDNNANFDLGDIFHKNINKYHFRGKFIYEWFSINECSMHMYVYVCVCDEVRVGGACHCFPFAHTNICETR